MRRSPEFATTVRRGRRGSSGALTVHVAPGLAVPVRVGFVVNRSVGGSVVRNRVRRRLRHLVAARLRALPSDAAIVVRVHPAAAVMTSAELGGELDRAFAKATA